MAGSHRPRPWPRPVLPSHQRDLDAVILDDGILEDGRGADLRAATGAEWRCVSDTVMGGVSSGQLRRTADALHLSGTVSLENNGGFVQMALPLAPRGQMLDATRFNALRLTVRGNDADYNLHLRSADMTAVWQSWRATFHAFPEWQEITLPFSQFTPHRTALAFDPSRLTRLGLVAIGQVMVVDLHLARLEFLRV
ncbi:MAG: hypothetical protein EA339_04170 [Rhodobacteraceae bacterium]|nr:MAG: hypothetical protein EA339_04170 [Paracoccaceae bacterium]